jgi:hypothetical protein
MTAFARRLGIPDLRRFCVERGLSRAVVPSAVRELQE